VNGSLPGKGGTAWRRQVRKQRENAMVNKGEVGWQLMKQRYRGSTEMAYNRRRRGKKSTGEKGGGMPRSARTPKEERIEEEEAEERGRPARDLTMQCGNSQGGLLEEDSPPALSLTICSRTSGDEGVKKTSTRNENAVRERPEGGAGGTSTSDPNGHLEPCEQGRRCADDRHATRQRSAEQARGRRWGVTTSDLTGYLQPHER